MVHKTDGWLVFDVVTVELVVHKTDGWLDFDVVTVELVVHKTDGWLIFDAVTVKQTTCDLVTCILNWCDSPLGDTVRQIAR